MNKAKRKRLERKGWKVGSAEEFLGLSAEESRYLELKFELSRQLRERREQRNLTQVQFARRLQSSQSRVAKMEAGDPSVSLDLLVRSLFSLGTSKRDLARIIASAGRSHAAR
jgi:predicted XRE-type DNA-binding protein